MTIPSTFSNNLTKSDSIGTAAVAIDTLSEKAVQAAAQAKHVALETARHAREEYEKAKHELGKVADQTERLAHENPWAAAATLIGVGALLGALAMKLFTPKPSVQKLLGAQMKNRMATFNKYF